MTDKQIAKILDSMVILVDTRERKNSHIIDYFDDNKIPYETQKLNVGDYSIKLPEEFGIDGTKISTVERKNSLNEIAGNFTKDRERFTREFERSLEDKVHVHLMIENATWRKILSESYRSKLPAKSFIASILTWSIRYNIKVWFLNPVESGMFIRNMLYYELREYLKGV